MTITEFENIFEYEVLPFVLDSRKELSAKKRGGVFGFEVEGQVLRLGFSWCKPGEEQVMMYE